MKMLLPILLWVLLPGVVAGQSPNVIARNCAPNSSEAIFDSGGRGSEEGEEGKVGKDTVPQAQLQIASRDARASHPSRDDVHATTLRELGAPNVIARNCAFNSSEAIFDSDGRGSRDTVPQAQLKIASVDARASHPSRDDDGGIASPDACASHPSRDDVNATTLAVLRANRPERFTEEEWLRMMQEPVNRALFPLRITQGMLDTLDGREMDLRFRYMWMEE